MLPPHSLSVTFIDTYNVIDVLQRQHHNQQQQQQSRVTSNYARSLYNALCSIHTHTHKRSESVININDESIVGQDFITRREYERVLYERSSQCKRVVRANAGVIWLRWYLGYVREAMCVLACVVRRPICIACVRACV